MRPEAAMRREMRRHWSSALLALAGLILVGLGFYFVFLRPPLLPEDQRYIGASLAQLEAIAPGAPRWLRQVFRVMGGYMVSTGLLTVYLAWTSFRLRGPGAVAIAASARLASIGWMVAINFMIDSNFKWLPLSFALPWVAAIGLSGAGK